MARILITSGPTRQYIDPVRYLSNGSSGRMGNALARAALALGHDVVIVSGPVAVEYPANAKTIYVVTTEEMLEICHREFQKSDGVIGAAAPCDYRPERMQDQKIAKTGRPLVLHLHETPDVIATLGTAKENRWVVGFALETDDRHFRAITKLERKCCDLMVLNGPDAIDASENEIEIIDSRGDVVLHCRGGKNDLATKILAVIQTRLVESH